MKNLKLIFVIICLASLMFTSCEKEEYQQNELCRITKIQGPWGKHRNPITEDCPRGGIFCQERIWQDCLTDDFNEVQLSVGDVAGTGKIIVEDNYDIIEFNFLKHNLEAEDINQLFKEKSIEFVDFKLDAELINELYTNTGVPNHGKDILIRGGTYPINLIESSEGILPNPQNAKIKVLVIFKDGITVLEISVYN